MQQTAIIIGAGPAGLTAALEMQRRTGIRPIVLEASGEIGGLSRTVRYKGNRMDIGGHRFFSKSDRVMNWWLEMMPVAESEDTTGVRICYHGQQRDLPASKSAAAPPPCGSDLVMLVRPRRSRIFYLRRFFDYPVTLSRSTVRNLGPARMARIGASYARARLHPRKPEATLEDFLINRFGKALYRTFFEDYTEKVWGTPCRNISASWGRQRVKGLSLTRTITHVLRKSMSGGSRRADIAQKAVETSLIERFLYPKLGPGQLWEHVAATVVRNGGEVLTGWKMDRAILDGKRLRGVEAVHSITGERRKFTGDLFLSTMPMQELTAALRAGGAQVPANVQEVSDGLQYRDFISVGVLANRLAIQEADGALLRDTWIYVQEPDVQLGRVQIFNNWSPHLVEDPTKVWIGLEYFCSEQDAIWKMPDAELQAMAAAELEKIGILHAADVLDAHVVRVPKTYPAYFGTYDRFSELRDWTDTFENLYLIGRNGMHKYNNQDHSMLTAMTLVDGLAAGSVDRAALWSLNTEQEYHEEKA